MRSGIAVLGLAFGLASVPACTSLYLSDCGEVLGNDVPRIRSATVRMEFGDASAAAARFVPYAAMAALAYAEHKDCGHRHKIKDSEEAALRKALDAPIDGGPAWERFGEAEFVDECEDAQGLYYHVWTRKVDGRTEAVIAFRGTWGWKDWLYGNFHWFTRLTPVRDQYDNAVRYTERVIARVREKLGSDTRFYATGHSLGGGLAQTALYHFPDEVVQAFAFDPSPATGFADASLAKQLQGCQCRQALGAEARIYRFYESYEILTHLRFVHKLFFAPNRHIHEVRFAFHDSPNLVSQHSMVALADSLMNKAGEKKAGEYAKPWYAGREQACTAMFEAGQAFSCAKTAKEQLFQTCP